MKMTVYTLGGGEVLTNLFNALAILISGDHAGKTGSIFNICVRMAWLIGFTVALYGAMWRDQMEVVRSFFMPFVFFLTLFFTPVASVWIIDPLHKTHDKVDHVPIGLAVTASVFSNFGHMITQKADQVFSLPDDLNYHKTGAVFASNLIQQTRQFKIVDENVAENMRGFVSQCVAYDALMGRKYTLQDLKNSPNIWGLVMAEPSPVRSFLWTTKGLRSEVVTCAVGASRLTERFQGADGVVSKSAEFFGRKIFRRSTSPLAPSSSDGTASSSEASMPNVPLNYKTELFKYLPVSFGYLLNDVRAAQDIMKQQIMISAVVDGIENKSVGLGNAPNFAVRKAYLQQRENFATMGALAGDWLVVARVLLEALVYMSIMFIFPLTLMPKGVRYLKSWAYSALWINIWGPFYSVLNMVMTLYAQSRSVSMSGIGDAHGMTIANSVGIMDFNADITAMAGYAAIMIPLMAWGLVHEGSLRLPQLSSSLSSVVGGVAARASDEIVSGNFSFGNVSQGTVQAGNTTMNQHSSSAHWQSGAFSQNDGRISETTTHDGHQIIDQKVSALASNLNITESMQESLQHQASKSYTAAQNQMVASSSHQASAFRDAMELAKHEAVNQNLSTSDSDSASGGLSKQLNFIKDKTEDFAKQHRLDYSTAASILAEGAASAHFGFNASKGINIFGTGAQASVGASGSIGVRANKSGTSTEAALLQEAQNFAKREGLSEALSHTVQAVHDRRFTASDDVGSRLSDSISGSQEQSIQFRQESAASFQRAHSFSESSTRVSSHASTISDNVTQDYKDWLAEQSYMGGGHPMGHHQAKHILLNDPQANKVYQQEFLAQRQAGLEAYWDKSDIQSASDIERGYQSFAQNTPFPEMGMDHSPILERARQDGIHHLDERVSGQGSALQQQVESRNAQALSDFDRRVPAMEEEMRALGDRIEEAGQTGHLAQAAKQFSLNKGDMRELAQEIKHASGSDALDRAPMPGVNLKPKEK